MNVIDLRKRLGKLELRDDPSRQAPVTILTQDDDDRARQLHDMAAAGLYLPGAPVSEIRLEPSDFDL